MAIRSAEIDSDLQFPSCLRMSTAASVRTGIVATNPPFGRKSSIKVIGEEGDVGSEVISYERVDFWATTSNKQLNVI